MSRVWLITGSSHGIRLPGLGVLAAALSLADDAPPAVFPADPPGGPLSHRLACGTGLVEQEPVPELGIVTVCVGQRVDPVCLGRLDAGDRPGRPPVAGLAGQPQHPARHRHGHDKGHQRRNLVHRLPGPPCCGLPLRRRNRDGVLQVLADRPPVQPRLPRDLPQAHRTGLIQRTNPPQLSHRCGSSTITSRLPATPNRQQRTHGPHPSPHRERCTFLRTKWRTFTCTPTSDDDDPAQHAADDADVVAVVGLQRPTQYGGSVLAAVSRAGVERSVRCATAAAPHRVAAVRVSTAAAVRIARCPGRVGGGHTIGDAAGPMPVATNRESPLDEGRPPQQRSPAEDTKATV